MGVGKESERREQKSLEKEGTSVLAQKEKKPEYRRPENPFGREKMFSRKRSFTFGAYEGYVLVPVLAPHLHVLID